jgi:hypothetical protein
VSTRIEVRRHHYRHIILHPISTRRLFAQFLISQNSKGKYESRKIFDFVRKFLRNYFFGIFHFFCCFFYFLVILKCSYYFGIFKFFDFFEYFEFKN